MKRYVVDKSALEYNVRRILEQAGALRSGVW